MDLHTGRTIWTETLSTATSFSPLERDERCDVLVVGGGEGGALCAWALAEAGMDVVVLEKSRVGQGSTRGNTGLLQFTNDTPLHQLMKWHGVSEAVHFYQMCQAAVAQLEQIAKSLQGNVEFQRRSSLYYASSVRDVATIQEEYQALSTNHFPVELLSKSDIHERFGFTKEAALVTHGDAEINPYRLTLTLFEEGTRRWGIRVYEQTEVISYAQTSDYTIARTTDGYQIRAKYVVFATGYETQQIEPLPGAQVGSTYAIATEPVSDLSAWPQQMLIWETARPYLYLRTTADRRILVGGLDGSAPDGRRRDDVLLAKTEQLREELGRLFPIYGDVPIAYRWASSFGSTRDGMPLIGEHQDLHNAFYALGYGGNGTVYYAIAANVIRGLIVDGHHPDAHLFQPLRMKLLSAAAHQVGRLTRSVFPERRVDEEANADPH